MSKLTSFLSVTYIKLIILWSVSKLRIHVVKPGESIYSIAKIYNVPYQRILRDNEIDNPQHLVVGEALVILQGNRLHRVTRGESIYTIARNYNVTPSAIMGANPQISGLPRIDVGDVLFIPNKSMDLGTIDVNGYALPDIELNTLRKTLPYLTYLSIFSHQVRADGSIADIPDEPLIRAARAAGVAPLMVVTNIKEGASFDADIAHAILTNPVVQNNFLNNVIRTLRQKNYYGLDLDFEYLHRTDRVNYDNFVRKVVATLRPLGYIVTSALAPKTKADQPGILYEAHDYPVHGALLNHVILMTYEWGYTYSAPMAVAPIDEVAKVLNYAISAIPRNKILMGVPTYGYVWTLPYKPGTAARAVSYKQAIDLARRYGAHIQYDQKSQAPFFTFYDENKKENIVWFEDARSIRAKLLLLNKYRLGGLSYWTIQQFFAPNWLVLSSMYNIRKVL